MTTRSKAKAKTNRPDALHPDANLYAQVNQVTRKADSSPLRNQPSPKSPFTSPFARSNSFMRNVLSRVQNPPPVVSGSNLTVQPTLIEPSQSSPTESPKESTLIDPESIKKEDISPPRKRSPTPEDYISAAPSRQLEPQLTISSTESNVASVEPTSLAASTDPSTDLYHGKAMPNASNFPSQRIQTTLPAIKESTQRIATAFNTAKATLPVETPRNLGVTSTKSSEVPQENFVPTPADLSGLRTSFRVQQASISGLRHAQQENKASMQQIQSDLTSLLQTIGTLVPPAENQPPAIVNMHPAPHQPHVDTSDEFISLRSSDDESIPPVARLPSSEDDYDPTHNQNQRGVPTAIPTANTPNGMMPVQFVRVSDLDVLNTRNDELVFPTFNPDTHLFHVWKGAALRKAKNHHVMGGHVNINRDGSLSFNENMPIDCQALLLDSLKEAMPDWFWSIHVPDSWEIRPSTFGMNFAVN